MAGKSVSDLSSRIYNATAAWWNAPTDVDGIVLIEVKGVGSLLKQEAGGTDSMDLVGRYRWHAWWRCDFPLIEERQNEPSSSCPSRLTLLIFALPPNLVTPSDP